MPEMKKNKKQSKTPSANGVSPKTPAPETDRPTIYPDLEVNGVKINPDSLRITADKMKILLGWETEEDWIARRRKEDPSLKNATLSFATAKPEIEPLLVDEEKNRVVCWHNLGNRPFDEATARKYAQDILTRNWAGYHNGETINGEGMIVGRTGRVMSGQHRGVGTVLAAQLWAKQRSFWAKHWTEEPFVETLIVFGVSESPGVVRTLDNVRARTLADTIYTSPAFAGITQAGKRRQCSKSLGAAISLLWKRTGAAETADKYQTHAASFAFQDRHKRLERAVRFIMDEDEDGARSHLKGITTGLAATALYLMGTSASDIDDYRGETPAPSEKSLDFSRWDAAEEFWTVMMSGEEKIREPLQSALALLYDEEVARTREKLLVLAKAWNLWIEAGTEPHQLGKVQATKDLLALHYHAKNDGTLVLTDDDTFGGIDLGQAPEPQDEDATTEEEVEAEKARIRAEDAARVKASVAKAKAEKEQALRDAVERRKKKKDTEGLTEAGREAAKKQQEEQAKKDHAKKKRITRKDVERENTRKAAEADARMAEEVTA